MSVHPTDMRNLQQAETCDPKRLSLTRKLLHLAMALLPVAGWWVSYWLELVLAVALLTASLAVEAARRWWPGLNHFLWRLLPTTFRPWEGHRLLGSTWLALGCLATILFFGRDIGGTAVLFLAWGDPAAEIVGRRWGKPGERKTLAGSLGCLAVCLLAGLAGIDLGGMSGWAVLGGAVTATLVERWSPPPDDNLWMPILSALVMAVIQWWIGGQAVLFPLWR